MANILYTVTNTDPKGFVQVVGNNFTVAAGKSVIVEQWQLIPNDLIDISEGRLAISPPLDCQVTGQAFRLGEFLPDKGPTLDKIIVDLRCDVIKIQALTPTQNQKDALDNAPTAPTGINPFVTQADLAAVEAAQVDSVVGGTAVTVDNTDPENPIVNVDLGISNAEAAFGDHTHATLPTINEKDALGASGTPATISNPYVTVADIPGFGGLSPVNEQLPVTSTGQTVFILTFTPFSSSTVLHVNAIQQQPGVDFIVLGTTLTWLDVDFTLDTSDVLLANYFK